MPDGKFERVQTWSYAGQPTTLGLGGTTSPLLFLFVVVVVVVVSKKYEDDGEKKKSSHLKLDIHD